MGNNTVMPLQKEFQKSWAILEGMNLKCSDFFRRPQIFPFQLSFWQAGSRRLNTSKYNQFYFVILLEVRRREA